MVGLYQRTIIVSRYGGKISIGAGCGISGTTIYANGKGAKVNTATVQKGSITQYVEVEGHIETEDEKSYYAKVSAPVEQFELEIGDVVEKESEE